MNACLLILGVMKPIPVIGFMCLSEDDLGHGDARRATIL
jgi:hypothetical protein